jgi:hypothetical protein
MRGLIIFSLSIVIAAASGCKKSKQDRCDAVYRQMMALVQEMAKQFGEDAEKPTAEDKKKFMALCEKLPDDAVECMSLEKMGDKRCAEILEKAQEEAAASAEPVPLEWETVKVEERITVQVPKGWTHEDFMGSRYTPPKEADLGFFTEMTISTSCGGSCEPLPAAEWAKRVEESVFAPLTEDADAKIVKDEKLGETGRLIRAKVKMGATMEHITVAFWKDGSSEYVTCHAELPRELAGNVADFEKACREMKIE